MADRKETLLRLLSVPTAPYRENAVRAFVSAELEANGVPHFTDPVGNIVVGASSKADYLAQLRNATAEPIRFFISHLDHPGFHGKHWRDDRTLEIEWFGGSPIELLDGAKVKLHAHPLSAEPYEAEGTLSEIELAPHGRALKKAVVTLTVAPPLETPDAEKVFGAFAFRAPAWEDEGLIYSKACDDLVGAFAILELAREAYATKTKTKPRKGIKIRTALTKRPPFLAILTRAEEVGFIGTIGHFELGWFSRGKRPRFVVSLETSRTLPQAEIGMGPILRLGDRMNVFDPGLTQWMVKLAEKVLPKETQKRIMDAGACEGSAALAYGFRTIAMSVPLGNYHNQSFQGGPDSRGENGPAPEYVSLKDVERLQRMVTAITNERIKLDEVYAPVRKAFRQSFLAAKGLLKAGQKG